jgi:AraC-like DNA-binding protein
MLIEARFDAHHPATHLVSRPSFEPVEPNAAIFEETKWREPKHRLDAGGIALSRWAAAQGSERTHHAVTPDDCHVVALALRPTRLSLSTPSRQLFEGSMPSGMILVSRPGQQLRASVAGPFDFLHIHVGNRLLSEEGLIADEDDFIEHDDLPAFRDALAEALGRSLLEQHHYQPEYAKIVAKAIVMRTIGRQQAKRRCWALPKWRMKRLEQYLSDNVDKRVTLDDMAASVGLSKMHFAAQFRAATGFRPREYLLFKRVELAKTIIASTNMPLVEVAFAVGFHAQAHFSTVFKRFTGRTPVQWKQEYRRAVGSAEAGATIAHHAIEQRAMQF